MGVSVLMPVTALRSVALARRERDDRLSWVEFCQTRTDRWRRAPWAKRRTVSGHRRTLADVLTRPFERRFLHRLRTITQRRLCRICTAANTSHDPKPNCENSKSIELLPDPLKGRAFALLCTTAQTPIWDVRQAKVTVAACRPSKHATLLGVPSWPPRCSR